MSSGRSFSFISACVIGALGLPLAAQAQTDPAPSGRSLGAPWKLKIAAADSIDRFQREEMEALDAEFERFAQGLPPEQPAAAGDWLQFTPALSTRAARVAWVAGRLDRLLPDEILPSVADYAAATDRFDESVKSLFDGDGLRNQIGGEDTESFRQAANDAAERWNASNAIQVELRPGTMQIPDQTGVGIAEVDRGFAIRCDPVLVIGGATADTPTLEWSGGTVTWMLRAGDSTLATGETPVSRSAWGEVAVQVADRVELPASIAAGAETRVALVIQFKSADDARAMARKPADAKAETALAIRVRRETQQRQSGPELSEDWKSVQLALRNPTFARLVAAHSGLTGASEKGWMRWYLGVPGAAAPANVPTGLNLPNQPAQTSAEAGPPPTGGDATQLLQAIARHKAQRVRANAQVEVVPAAGGGFELKGNGANKFICVLELSRTANGWQAVELRKGPTSAKFTDVRILGPAGAIAQLNVQPVAGASLVAVDTGITGAELGALIARLGNKVTITSSVAAGDTNASLKWKPDEVNRFLFYCMPDEVEKFERARITLRGNTVFDLWP